MPSLSSDSISDLTHSLTSTNDTYPPLPPLQVVTTKNPKKIIVADLNIEEGFCSQLITDIIQDALKRKQCIENLEHHSQQDKTLKQDLFEGK